VVYKAPDAAKRVVSQNVAAQASGMLHDVVERGTGVNARFGSWAAGKTGTTQNYRDAWFVGYTPVLVTSVWVGHRDGQVAMTNVHGIRVAGGTFPARIWGRFMGQVGGSRPVTVIGSQESSETTAAGVSRVNICSSTFLLANPRCPKPEQVEIRPELIPKSVCNVH